MCQSHSNAIIHIPRRAGVGARARGAGGRWGAQAAGGARGAHGRRGGAGRLAGAGRRADTGGRAGGRGERGRRTLGRRGARAAGRGGRARARAGQGWLGARPGRWAGLGLCTQCTRPVFGPVRLGIFLSQIFLTLFVNPVHEH